MWIGRLFFNSRHSWNSRTKLDTILELIDKNYVDEIDTDSILEASFSGLMSHLDPHSVYIPASDLRECQRRTGRIILGHRHIFQYAR